MWPVHLEIIASKFLEGFVFQDKQPGQGSDQEASFTTFFDGKDGIGPAVISNPVILPLIFAGCIYIQTGTITSHI